VGSNISHANVIDFGINISVVSRGITGGLQGCNSGVCFRGVLQGCTSGGIFYHGKVCVCVWGGGVKKGALF
jgi:hypothetical protein